jgi:hypothetical protein
MAEDALVYLEACPVCGGRIPEPFLTPALDPYPMVYTHLRGHRRPSCRIRVTVHPDGNLEAEALEDDVSYEAALLGGT